MGNESVNLNRLKWRGAIYWVGPVCVRTYGLEHGAGFPMLLTGTPSVYKKAMCRAEMV